MAMTDRGRLWAKRLLWFGLLYAAGAGATLLAVTVLRGLLLA